MGDRRLAAVLGAAMFAIVAWPLLFLRVLPYQDVPGHLAAVTVLANPAQYPELVPTGFFKPNSFFFLWTLTVGRSVGFLCAAKLYALLILAANAFVLPRFVLHFADRKRMLLAAPFLVPMVHNWFVSMGMLNFAASVPVAALLLVALEKKRPLPAAWLGLLSWYLHPFPVMVVGLMVVSAIVFEKADRRERVREWLLPLVPAGLAAAIVLGRHAAVAGPKMESPVYSTPGWAIYNLWSQWFYGFTELTAVSIWLAGILALFAIVRFRAAKGLFGPAPLLAILALYFFGPYVAFDANYIAPRLIPFVWLCALVRIPDKFPRPLVWANATAAAIYVGGLAVDLFRLSHEMDAYAAGTEMVPVGARLLQMNFNARPTSKNTFSLGTAWGLYVVEKKTSAVDVWANVPSMPFVYKTPLAPALEPMRRLRFIKNAAHRNGFCAALKADGFLGTDCEARWRAEWERYWDETLPAFDHLLLWDPPAEVVEVVPWKESFARGRLHIYSRDSSFPSAAAAESAESPVSKK
jgi:hypothetical protein